MWCPPSCFLCLQIVIENGEYLVDQNAPGAIAADGTTHAQSFQFRTVFAIERTDCGSVMIGYHHADIASCKVCSRFGETLLVGPVETASLIIGKRGGATQRHIGRITIDDVAAPGTQHTVAKILLLKAGAAGVLEKMQHLLAREIGPVNLTERCIEFTAAVVPAQTVVAMAVEIQKQCGVTSALNTIIEFRSQAVKGHGIIVVRFEKLGTFVNKVFTASMEILIERDQIGITVRQQITIKTGVEKNGGRADEWLDQFCAWTEGGADICQEAILAARPFQERSCRWPGYAFDDRSSGVRARILSA